MAGPNASRVPVPAPLLRRSGGAPPPVPLARLSRCSRTSPASTTRALPPILQSKLRGSLRPPPHRARDPLLVLPTSPIAPLHRRCPSLGSDPPDIPKTPPSLCPLIPPLAPCCGDPLPAPFCLVSLQLPLRFLFVCVCIQSSVFSIQSAPTRKPHPRHRADELPRRVTKNLGNSKAACPCTRFASWVRDTASASTTYHASGRTSPGASPPYGARNTGRGGAASPAGRAKSTGKGDNFRVLLCCPPSFACLLLL